MFVNYLFAIFITKGDPQGMQSSLLCVGWGQANEYEISFPFLSYIHWMNLAVNDAVKQHEETKQARANSKGKGATWGERMSDRIIFKAFM